MRIKLKEGKQKELILLAKGNLIWKKIADVLNVNDRYLYYELKNENILLKKELYEKLCKVVNKNFDEFVIEELNERWGQSKGGLNSKGSTINIKMPEKGEKLAELIGIILGDGNVNYYKRGKKIGVYQVSIAGHKNLDRDYHLSYISPLFDGLFSLKAKKLNTYILNLKESLKNIPHDEVIKVQENIIKLEHSKKRINKLLGRIVIK